MTKIELERVLTDFRKDLESGFSANTAYPGSRYTTGSAGHCAAVAILVKQCFDGHLVSADVQGESHWFNRINLNGHLVDVDLTGDQFGLPRIQIKKANQLYSGSKVRQYSQLAPETIKRAEALANCIQVAGKTPVFTS